MDVITQTVQLYNSHKLEEQWWSPLLKNFTFQLIFFATIGCTNFNYIENCNSTQKKNVWDLKLGIGSEHMFSLTPNILIGIKVHIILNSTFDQETTLNL